MRKRLLLAVHFGERELAIHLQSVQLKNSKDSKLSKKVINNGRSIKRFWAKLSKKYNIPINIMGTDAIPSFEFLKNHITNKTFLTQEMLKNNILATNMIYVNIFHSKKNIGKYF